MRTRRQRKQADRVDERRDRAYVVRHLGSSLCSQRERRNAKSARPTKNISTTHKAALVRVIREGFAFISNASKIHCSSLRPFFKYFVHACGVRLVFLEHGPPGHCKSSILQRKIVDLSVRLSFVLFFLVSERSGFLSEPSALYCYLTVFSRRPEMGRCWLPGKVIVGIWREVQRGGDAE